MGASWGWEDGMATRMPRPRPPACAPVRSPRDACASPSFARTGFAAADRTIVRGMFLAEATTQLQTYCRSFPMPSPSSELLADLLPQATESSERIPLVVFSHLRWGFVFQRPQHLLTRLARHFDVLFVEEPVLRDGEPGLRCVQQASGLEVLTPYTDVQAGGFH